MYSGGYAVGEFAPSPSPHSYSPTNYRVSTQVTTELFTRKCFELHEMMDRLSRSFLVISRTFLIPGTCVNWYSSWWRNSHIEIFGRISNNPLPSRVQTGRPEGAKQDPWATEFPCYRLYPGTSPLLKTVSCLDRGMTIDLLVLRWYYYHLHLSYLNKIA